jgi:hypothetical protein
MNTKKNTWLLRLRGIFWVLRADTRGELFFKLFKRPFRSLVPFVRSFVKKKPYIQDSDFFLYGLQTEDEFIERISRKDTALLVALSYCSKPLECPSGRFTHDCIPVKCPSCETCLFKKVRENVPNAHFFVVTTTHSIGKKLLELQEQYPKKEVLFLISACELSLHMFSDLGNMVEAKGIGIRLQGPVCTTWKAFEHAERGIKPKKTMISLQAENRLFRLLDRIQKGIGC